MFSGKDSDLWEDTGEEQGFHEAGLYLHYQGKLFFLKVAVYMVKGFL